MSRGGRYALALDGFVADLDAQMDVAHALAEVPALKRAGAVYRADACFEAMADLSDALAGVEQGRLGEDVVRTEALRVCRLAVLLWLSVCAGEDGDDGC